MKLTDQRLEEIRATGIHDDNDVMWIVVEVLEYRARDRRLAEGLAELERVRNGKQRCLSCGELRKHLWHECRKPVTR